MRFIGLSVSRPVLPIAERKLGHELPLREAMGKRRAVWPERQNQDIGEASAVTAASRAIVGSSSVISSPVRS